MTQPSSRSPQMYAHLTAEAEAFAVLADHAVGEPRSLQALRQLATDGGAGTLSERTLRGQVAALATRLTSDQLDTVVAAAATQPPGSDAARVELDRFFEQCFLGRLELLRRKFIAGCCTDGSAAASWDALFADSDSADYVAFRDGLKSAIGEAEESAVGEADLRQLFDFLDEGRRGEIDQERFDEVLGMGLGRSLVTERSAELRAPLFARIAAALQLRGSDGVAALQRLRDRAPAEREEFRQQLRQLNVPLAQMDAELLYVLLDRDYNGRVSVDQLLALIAREEAATLGPVEMSPPPLRILSPRRSPSLGTSVQEPTLRLTPAAASISGLRTHRPRRSTVRRATPRPARGAPEPEPEPEPNGRTPRQRRRHIEREYSRSPRSSPRRSPSRVSFSPGLSGHIEREYSRSPRSSPRRSPSRVSFSPGLSGSDSDPDELSPREPPSGGYYIGGPSMNGVSSELVGLVKAAHDERTAGYMLTEVALELCDRTHISPEMRLRVERSGGIAALVELLRRGDELTRGYAAQALATLGADGERQRDEVAQSGAVAYLAQMLAEPRWGLSTSSEEADEAKGSALECVAVIAHRSVHNATGVGRVGVVEGVVRGLKHAGGLRARALLCLQALVESAVNRPLVAEAKGIPLLLRCCQEAAEDGDSESVSVGVGVLAELARGSPALQTQLVDYMTAEVLTACDTALPWDLQTQRLAEELEESVADERQRRMLYDVERDAHPNHTWSVGAVASWIAGAEIDLPEHAHAFRRLDIDGATLAAVLRGTEQWTLSELWRELGIESRHEQTKILSAMRQKGETMNALAQILTATAEYNETGKKVWEPTRPHTTVVYVETLVRELFWVVKYVKEIVGPWQRQRQILRGMLPLYALYHLIPWYFAALPPPPPPPSPPGAIVEAANGVVDLIYTEVGATGLMVLLLGGLLYVMQSWAFVGVLHTLANRSIARLSGLVHRAPKRYYRCVAQRPVAVTRHFEKTGWSTDGGTSNSEVGNVIPGEVVEVYSFKSSGVSGQIRARVRDGWCDMVDAQRGVPLLVDIFTHPQERCFIRVFPAKQSTSVLSTVVSLLSPRDDDEEELLATYAEFGNADETWRLGEVLCVKAVPSRAERSLDNAYAVRGCVVVIDRGEVPFVTKARNAQAAGAVGVILVNDTDEPLSAHGHQNLDGTADAGADVVVPVLCVRKTAGEVLAARLPAVVEIGEEEDDETAAHAAGSY